jgi:hypothetical protein
MRIPKCFLAGVLIATMGTTSAVAASFLPPGTDHS